MRHQQGTQREEPENGTGSNGKRRPQCVASVINGERPSIATQLCSTVAAARRPGMTLLRPPDELQHNSGPELPVSTVLIIRIAQKQ